MKKIIIFILIINLFGCFSNDNKEDNNIDYEKMDIKTIASEGNILYSIDQYDGLVIYEIDNNNEIEILRRYNGIFGYKIKVEKDFLYLTEEYKLKIYDVRNKEEIKLIKEIPTNSLIKDFSITEDNVYLTTYSVSGPGQHHYASFGGKLLIVDIVDKENITLSKQIDITSLVTEGYILIQDIAVDEKYLYITDEGGKILIFNREGDYLKELSDDGVWIEFHAIEIREDILYVGGENILIIYDVSDINNIQEISRIELEKEIKELTLNNDVIYVYEKGRGLSVIDLSKMEVISNFKYIGEEILFKDVYMYMAYGANGIKVLDVSDIENIKEVGHILN